jgi:hypothetical protein
MKVTMSNISRSIVVALLLSTLAACASTGHQIGHNVTVCCPGDYASYQSYSLETSDMPEFLSDYVIAEFDAAFQEKGLVRNDRLNDIAVKLSYQHVNLNAEQEDIDPFDRRTGEGFTLRYIATINIEMFDNDEVIWAGQVHRIHNVTPGEYMHEDGARPEFRNAFRELLSSYPGL